MLECHFQYDDMSLSPKWYHMIWTTIKHCKCLMVILFIIISNAWLSIQQKNWHDKMLSKVNMKTHVSLG
jgi:hypothetical protein